MLLLKTSARGCIKSSSCWRLNDVKDFISVLACGITQQLRLFGLWDFSKWRGSTCSSRNFSTGVCFLWRWWGCHVASGRQSGMLPSLNFFASLGEWNHLLSVKGSEGKEERFFFFIFWVTKYCVVNSLTESLFGFVLVLKAFLKALSLK